jgi:hypothetical protein
VKFVLFVEGHTERKAIPSFLKRWLDPQLNQNVGIQPVRFEGWSEFLKKIARSASMHLNSSDSEQIIGAIGLLDLYGPYMDQISFRTTFRRRGIDTIRLLLTLKRRSAILSSECLSPSTRSRRGF